MNDPITTLHSHPTKTIWLFKHERDARAWIPIIRDEGAQPMSVRVFPRSLRVEGHSFQLWCLSFGPLQKS